MCPDALRNVNIILNSILYLLMTGGENILENVTEFLIENPEPYNSIYRFIESDILPKYPCLTSVFQDNFDEEGNPRIQYYVRYAADLSLSEWDELRSRIRESVISFCKSSGVPYGIYSEIDFILTVDGDYYAKYRKGF